MFLRFCIEKEEIHIVRDDQTIVDILYVKPEEKGILIYNRKTYDGEEVWETLKIGQEVPVFKNEFGAVHIDWNNFGNIKE